MARKIPVGIVFPQTDIGNDPEGIKAFAQRAEELGFSHIIAYDHVVGADLTNRPDWWGPYHLDSTFQEPLVLFSYWAGVTKKIKFSTGVIILPQRQTVLFGKQCATLDALSAGRLRVAVGIGWNKVEYDALAMPFDNKAETMEDQVRLLRRLWTERSFSDKGRLGEDIVEAGIWPMPEQQPIPIWFGGLAPAAMQRAARIGDGWLPIAAPEDAEATVAGFRDEVKKNGRDPSKVKIENLIFFKAPKVLERNEQPYTPEQIGNIVGMWEKAGADSVCIDPSNQDIKGVQAHIALMEKTAKAAGL